VLAYPVGRVQGCDCREEQGLIPQGHENHAEKYREHLKALKVVCNSEEAMPAAKRELTGDRKKLQEADLQHYGGSVARSPPVLMLNIWKLHHNSQLRKGSEADPSGSLQALIGVFFL
jgi:hypothetical protein